MSEAPKITMPSIPPDLRERIAWNEDHADRLNAAVEYGLAAYVAGMEAAAQIADALHDQQINSMTSHNYYRHGAAAIRRAAEGAPK